MSGMLNKGVRQQKVAKKKLIKKHIKGFHSSIKRINEIALELKDIDITEENVNEHASKLLGRDLDSMEKWLLLSKLNNNET